LRKIDKSIRDRIEALKIALRDKNNARRNVRRRGLRLHNRDVLEDARWNGVPDSAGLLSRLSRTDVPCDQPPAIDQLEGAREIESERGRCLVLEKEIGEYVRLRNLRKAVRMLIERGVIGPPGRQRYVFLDLETTGFAATPLFLAGTMFERDGKLYCSQLLARDYSEEQAVVDMLGGLIGDHDLCITFNGKSFDMPYLRERAKYHKLELPEIPEHLDLLHHARRAWRHSLPDCRLATLEWYILGRRRSGDVPGWEVPCIYHEFVHTNDSRRLMGVIRHNLLDVVSMAELLICLAEA